MLKSSGSKFVLFLSALLISANLLAQNLVVNPSFETVNQGILQCSWYTTQAQFNNAITGWTCPTGGSSDIFNSSLATSCFSSTMSTNSARVGQQNPRTGNTHTAVYVYGTGGCTPYREYVQGNLCVPLTAGVAYDVSFYVSLGDESTRGANNIGVKFSNTPVNVTSMCVYNATPDMNYTGPIITDKIGWTLISFTYTPTVSGQQYFMIGNFFNDASTSVANAGTGSMTSVRYFIDDVNVSPVNSSTTGGDAGTNGTASLCASGPTVNLFSYLGGSPTSNGTWTGPSTLTGGNLGTFDPAVNTAGTYTYTVNTSSSPCGTPSTSQAQIVVTFNGTGNATITQPADICVTGTAAQQVAATSGGVWSASCGACMSSAGVFDPSIAGLGTHSITYTLSAPCPGTDTKNIVVVGNPTVSAGNNVVICANENTQLTAVGANTYTWTPSTGLSGTTGANVTANPSSTTVYTVTGETAVGCTGQASVTVTVNALPVLTANTTNTICLNETVQLTVSGADTYVWTPAQTLSSSTGASVTASPQSTSTYTVTGMDAVGCSDQISISVTVNPLPVISIVSQNNVTCNGDANGNATISIAQGTAPYTTVWSPTGGTGLTANSLTAGTYTITVSDNQTCAAVQTITITEPSAITIDITSSIPADCGLSNGSLTASVQGGTGSYTYNWTPIGGNAATASNLPIGTYILNVTDSLNCSLTVSVDVDLPAVDPSFTLQVESTPETCAGNDGTATVTASGGTPPYSYLWNTGSITDSSFVSGLATGEYTITVSDECYTITEQVIVDKELTTPSKEVPNIFTPNNDNVNDVYTVGTQFESTENFYCIIYNRWGALVYQTENKSISWNPKNISDGTYFMVLSYKDCTGKDDKLTSTITVIGSK